MASIDRIYVENFTQYLQFKEWCENTPPIKDKYGKKGFLTNYMYHYYNPFNGNRPIFNAPYYLDAYLIRNCPFDFIQKELMINYRHSSYSKIKNGELYTSPKTSRKYVSDLILNASNVLSANITLLLNANFIL